jgi:hypothetical protein
VWTQDGDFKGLDDVQFIRKKKWCAKDNQASAPDAKSRGEQVVTSFLKWVAVYHYVDITWRRWPAPLGTRDTIIKQPW